jgi:Zn-finger nucleic acid-binding protein
MHLKPDEDSYRCDYCHAVYLPEKGDDGVRVLGDATTEACSICNVPLVNAAIAKVRILYCPQCHGMLIPMAALPPLVDELKSAQSGGAAPQPSADTSDLDRKINCPQCHHRMDTHLYAGPGNVVIDSCEDCSLIWLDRGELMHIVHAPDERDTEAWDDDTAA